MANVMIQGVSYTARQLCWYRWDEHSEWREGTAIRNETDEVVGDLVIVDTGLTMARILPEHVRALVVATGRMPTKNQLALLARLPDAPSDGLRCRGGFRRTADSLVGRGWARVVSDRHYVRALRGKYVLKMLSVK